MWINLLREKGEDMSRKIRVLMVDDEDRFRETTSKILTRKGFDVGMAADGGQALEMLRESPRDVVVLDIKMPGMSGEEALPKIREVCPDSRVIMLTGHGGLESARAALREGAFDYLNKPCDIDLLASKINDAAASRKGDVKREKAAEDIMIPIADYTTIYEDSTVREGIARLKEAYESFVATELIMESGHRAIIVFNRRDELVGVLNMRNLLGALRPEYLTAPKPSMADSTQFSPMFWTGLFSEQAVKLGEMKVRDIMSERPPVVEHDSNLMEVADTMYMENRRRVAVMRDGKITGIVREQELFYELCRILLRSESAR